MTGSCYLIIFGLFVDGQLIIATFLFFFLNELIKI